MENITDTYSQYFVNDIEHTENINGVKSANYYLNQFLSASAWCSIGFSDNFLLKELPAGLILNVLHISSSWKATSKYL